MIEISRKEDCCGCNACGDICPQKAISFSSDKEGFWYPEIDKAKCNNCGLCNLICPVKNESRSLETNFKQPKCYAAEHKSVEVIFSSTSGGMFSALADATYNEGGFVGGAVHNDDLSVSHFISNDRSDLQRLRRSKDLQSNAEGYYGKVKELLDAGNKVLSVGLPCQVAGLLNFLKKDYENLITVDLVCGGVNSPKVWRKYLDYIEEIAGSKIKHTENKAKEYGWHNLTQKFVFENGEEYFDTVKTSSFIKGYIGSHLYCRPSCYDCRFKGFPRVADITIGDFWGIENHTGKYNSDMGTSLVLVNSKKGEEYFEKASRRINCEEVPLDWALPGNPSLLKPVSRLSDKRNEFFEDLDHLRFDEVVEKYDVDHHKPSKLRRIARIGRTVVKTTRLHPKAVFQTLRYSGIRNLFSGKGIICGTHCQVRIDKSANLQFEGLLILGRKVFFPKSRLESRLFVGKNAAFKVLGDFSIDADNDIEVFDGAQLIIHGGKLGYSDANKGLTIVCGQRIEIMEDAGIGRGVTIRDTNGDSHFINTTGYRPSRPVVIGERAWLCESCTIMPGVKIGKGAIVGGCSMVTRSVPDHAMVSGNPAGIVQENVIWKC